MTRLAVVATLCALLVLAGCASGGDGTSGPQDDGAGDGTVEGGGSVVDLSTALAFESPDADDFNLLLESEDDLVELEVAEILGVDDVGPQRLVVNFEMGAHHCFGAQVSVVETGDQVVLDLRIGRRAGVPATACQYGIYPYTVPVDLAEPLDRRSIVVADRGATAGPTGTIGPASGSNGVGTSADLTAAPTSGADGAGPTVNGGDPTIVGREDPERLLGRHAEDGVEWALFHDRPWRILSNDGEVVADSAPTDSDRISFVVVADVIVGHEWS